MTVRLRLFALARDHAGFSDRSVEVADNATVGSLWEYLEKLSPAMAQLKSGSRFAVNKEYVRADHKLADGDEVALIPPVSGG